MVTIVMMSAKLATLNFFKIKVFWSKCYDFIIPVHDVISETLSSDSNCVVDMVVWPKFGNCTISMKEVIIISILQGFGQKNKFFWGVILVKVQ